MGKKKEYKLKPMNCSRCGFPIIRLQKYYKHEDGTILCVDCYNKTFKDKK